MLSLAGSESSAATSHCRAHRPTTPSAPPRSPSPPHRFLASGSCSSCQLALDPIQRKPTACSCPTSELCCSAGSMFGRCTQRRWKLLVFASSVRGLHQKATIGHPQVRLTPKRASCSQVSRLCPLPESPFGRISEKMQFKDADGKEVPRSPRDKNSVCRCSEASQSCRKELIEPPPRPRPGQASEDITQDVRCFVE